MSLPEPPAAVFCANDEMALGVPRAAKKHSIDIPLQLGLIGFDNIRISGEQLIVHLTSGGKARSRTSLVLRPELIVRETRYDVDITYIPTSDFNTKLNTAIATGQAPNV